MAIRLLLKALLNIVIVWWMSAYLSGYFALTGGIPAWIIVGALLTLMNFLVRPVLNLITLPLKLFASVIALILVNGLFVQLTYTIVQYMERDLVTLEIYGGLFGWALVAVIFGIANWLMKVLLK